MYLTRGRKFIKTLSANVPLREALSVSQSEKKQNPRKVSWTKDDHEEREKGFNLFFRLFNSHYEHIMEQQSWVSDLQSHRWVGGRKRVSSEEIKQAHLLGKLQHLIRLTSQSLFMEN